MRLRHSLALARMLLLFFGRRVLRIGVLRSTDTQTIEVEAASYEEGLAQLSAQIPEGWQLQHVRTEK